VPRYSSPRSLQQPPAELRYCRLSLRRLWGEADRPVQLCRWIALPPGWPTDLRCSFPEWPDRVWDLLEIGATRSAHDSPADRPAVPPADVEAVA
jgi:hypothetical protein